ncbi:ATP-dependent helicase [Proteiniphilum saccharofermentans]|uniref:ATP-dependent helicase n=1 Tax=Proteiniphilum saccharofermentans TaxID=1642647 RepID=UPI0028A6211A|nr:ATP-dependent helicase [Proteiniphilum saccharofermentans]
METNRTIELNEEQRKAVEYDGKHLLVLAGAGTGKTQTIISRAKYLIGRDVSPKRILILSFTRKSANEIVERIKSGIDKSLASDLKGQTFHSWCMEMIKSNPNIFRDHDFTVIDEDDRESSFKFLCGKKFKNYNKKLISPILIKEVYSFAVNKLIPLSQSISEKVYDGFGKGSTEGADASDPETLQIQQTVEKEIQRVKPLYQDIIQQYIKYKKERKYLDYDDILNIVSKTLKKDEAARDALSSLYDHILVDEAQDTNPLQYELLTSFQEKCRLYFVGDDAQSIYSFRGADFNTMYNFTDIFPDSEKYKLTINYRSTQELLDLSNWLLSESIYNYDKELKARRGKGNIPVVINSDGDWIEANDITDRILLSTTEEGLSFSDNMVLSRSVFGMRRVEASCIEKKIPYVIYGGSGIMKSKHVRDIVSAMRIISNYKDELAWMRYLMLWQGVGEVRSARIINNIIGENTLDDCIAKLIQEGLEKVVSSVLLNIIGLQDNPGEAMQRVVELMGDRMKDIYKEEWNWRKDDFPILQELATTVGSISDFIAEYVLDPKAETTGKWKGKTEDGVIISTIHSAKGLEAKKCYIINVSTFAYPTSRAVLQGNAAIEEERRCLYVAMTRAMDDLYIYRNLKSAHVYTINQESEKTNEKYFLNNLPSSLVNSINLTNRTNSIVEYHGAPVEIDLEDSFDFG